MSRTLPSVNWFELEVLSSISQEAKYGQQILNELTVLLSESVSSGRLYPVLQKLEKHGYVKKSEQERGRFFYSLTEQGLEEISTATHWSLRSLLNALTGKLVQDVSLRLQEHIRKDLPELGKRKAKQRKLAFIKIPPPQVFKGKQYRQLEYFCAGFPGLDVYSIWISDSREAKLPPGSGEENEELVIMDMAGSFQDIPLKDSYVDLLFLSDSYIHAPNREAHLQEVLRILKPGGRLYFTVIAKYDSYILESLVDIIHTAEGSGFQPNKGMEEEEVHRLLGAHLQDVKLERIKELILASGTKP